MVSLAGRTRRWGRQCSPFYVLLGRVCAMGGAGLVPRIATVHSDRDSHCRDFVGVRSGARLSTLLTLLKLLPLALIIALGVIRFSHHIQLLHASEIHFSRWRFMAECNIAPRFLLWRL